MAEKSVTLEPGQSKVVAFEASPSKAGTYQVSVDGLTGSFNAKAVEIPFVTVPCVYCGATFDTEEALIAHMESSHPRSPYLVSAYLPQSWLEQSRPTSLTSAPLDVKVYVPESEGHYLFIVEIDGALSSRTIYGSAPGFHELHHNILGYVAPSGPGPYGMLPLGTYEIKTRCAYVWGYPSNPQWRYLWSGVKTGLTIEIVEAPPPEPHIEVHYLKVVPAEVSVGDTVEITAAMRNTGELVGTGTLEVTVNGISLGTRTATLRPGQYQGWLFYFTPETAGPYLVEADGITKSFTAV